MSRWGLPARRLVLVYGGLALIAGATLRGRAALAQEGDEPPPELMGPEPSNVFANEPPPPLPPAPPAEPTPPVSPDVQRPASPAPSGVELLAADAFPPPHARGIPGGSLFWTLHGLHWPYLPGRAGQAGTRLGLSGLAWVDSSYRDLKSGSAAEPDRAEWEQRARLVLRANPTYNAPGDWFVQAQGELVLLGATLAPPEQTLGVDDLYVRVGKWNVFDLSAGRFQGWEVYHLGLGLEQHTTERRGAWTAQNPALDIGTDLQFLWDRRDGPGNVALHVYPLEFLRFELLGTFGGSGQANALGVRPAGILDFGVIKAKIAADYVQEFPREQRPELDARTIRRGIVGALQLVVAPLLEAGIAGGYALVDDYDPQGQLNPAGSNTTYSVGGFASVRVSDGILLGAGGAYTHQRNLEVDASGALNDIETHSQLYGAVQYSLWEQLHVKAVFAYASALFDPQSEPMPDTFRNRALNGRLRLAYWF